MRRVHITTSVLSTFVLIAIMSTAARSGTANVEKRLAQQRAGEIESGAKCITNSNSSDDGIAMAFPPEGCGVFRDPLEVLGPKFPPKVSIDLCQVRLLVYADVVGDVKFTVKGSKMCIEVCKQYNVNMKFDGNVHVSLLEGYCDYIGQTDFQHEPTDSDLSTTCTCAYKVRCNQRTRIITYTFESNCAGFLKVSVTESNKKHCIT